MRKPPLKDLPVVATLYLVQTGRSTVKKVDVVEMTPRHVVIKNNLSCRRELWRNTYHEYFKKFEEAKEWVRHELVTDRDLLQGLLTAKMKQLDDLMNLKESDL